ncbi:hypothetical protein OT109_05410 [Phycisphaeraceae bacterium D3-23]
MTDDQPGESDQVLDPASQREWNPNLLAGVGAVVLYVAGRILISMKGATWLQMIEGEFGLDRAGHAAGAVLAGLAVFLLYPWLVSVVLLVMIALGERLNPRSFYYLMAGGVVGVILMMGMHPIFLFFGLICGLFAGLLRAWIAVR